MFKVLVFQVLDSRWIAVYGLRVAAFRVQGFGISDYRLF